MNMSRSFTEPTARPTRPTYVPPHLRNNNGVVTVTEPEKTQPFGPTTDFSSSPGYRFNRAGYHDAGRGRGRGSDRGRGRGQGRWWGPHREVYDQTSATRNEDPFDIADKFDELEVVEGTQVGGAINFDAYEDIPVQTSGSDAPPPVNTFAEIDLGKALNDNIQRCKYVKPTPIQRYAIPIAIAGRDLMACAQTGSGKTAAFCFPIISGILRNYNRGSHSMASRGLRIAYPLALILSPTRELSCQIYEEAKKFSYQTGIKLVVAYGGAPISQQFRNLERGVDILVATPGRLVDMIERDRVSLRMIQYLALDEADRMLDMGFEPQIRKIVEQMEMPPPGSRQTLLFSATFPTEIQRLASDFLSNYIFLAAGRVGSSTDLIVQRVNFVRDMDKRNHLMNLLKASGTNGKHSLTLVFVETKRGADALEHWLSMNGFPATAIHGDKVQRERERALKSFKSGFTPILVATDVAARGLDIPHVAHVINFDLPRDIDDYVHRIGRTGRAGKSGLATAFFSDKNAPIAKALCELMQEANQEVPPWLSQYVESSSYSGGGRAHRHGRSKFGGHDFRSGAQFKSGNYNSSPYADAVGDTEPYAYVADNYYASARAETYTAASHGYEYDHGSVVASGWD